MDNLSQRTMAFAGICQAVKLIQEIARDGEINDSELEQSLKSIMVTDPQQARDVYGSCASLEKGYHVLVQQLAEKQQKDPELTRYIIGILMLERALMKKTHALTSLADRIQDVERQLGYFKMNDPQVIANLASIYSDIISPLGPRIMISGKQHHIQNQLNQHKIRALLLSTMRSAVFGDSLVAKEDSSFGKHHMVKQANSN